MKPQLQSTLKLVRSYSEYTVYSILVYNIFTLTVQSNKSVYHLTCILRYCVQIVFNNLIHRLQNVSLG